MVGGVHDRAGICDADVTLLYQYELSCNIRTILYLLRIACRTRERERVHVTTSNNIVHAALDTPSTRSSSTPRYFLLVGDARRVRWDTNTTDCQSTQPLTT